MDVTLTEQLKLTFVTDTEKQLADDQFLTVAQRYADACNFVSEYHFEHGCCISYTKLHKALYGTIRIWFGLKSLEIPRFIILRFVRKSKHSTIRTPRSGRS